MPKFVALMPILAALVLAVAPVPARGDDVNAADLYHQAIDALPSSGPSVKTLTNPESATPEELKAALAEGGASLRLAHQALSAGACDWKLDTSRTGKPNLAFLNPIRQLIALQNVQARQLVADGKSADAAQVLVDAMVMGRRVQSIDLIAARLVGQACEMSASATMAELFPAFSADTARGVWVAVKGFANPPTLEQSIAGEERVNGQPVPDPLRADLKKIDDVHAATIALLQAILAAPASATAEDFKSTKDPVGGEPFGYAKTQHGYQLSSKATGPKGQPTFLIVGAPDK